MAKNSLNFLENYTHPDEFGKWLGYKLDSIDKKKQCAHVSLTIRKDHLSPAGRVHGGVISSFFDFACGAAVFSTLATKDFCSTVELKVNYFMPLGVGDKLRAKTQVIFRGKRLCVIHGLLYRTGEKKPVAMATATFNVVSV
ncbi:MAG: PaaI family thioesterase [Deltaproteobacteria bacterium]|nr:PaaI family thioesterase [Deltaproteobacteria bacterium]MBI4925686.1 PaaI family thioesterase [Bdellovibrio sp.]